MNSVSYLVDSDVVVDWLEGRSQAVQLLSSLVAEGLALSFLSYGEIYEGVYYSRDPKASEAIFQQFLQQVTLLAIDEEIMKRFALLRGQLRASGQIIGDFDCSSLRPP